MPESTVRPDSVNVEQIMDEIRARIREKRGVDYSEQQVRDLAAAKLEKLLEQFRRTKAPAPPPNFAFAKNTLFESREGHVPFFRRLFRPFLRLFINPDAIADALSIQSQLNERQAQLEASRHRLYDELIHNLVVESARLGLDVKHLKMRVESLASRLDFSERRVRSLESAQITRGATAEASSPLQSAPALVPASAPAQAPAPMSAPAITPNAESLQAGAPARPGSPTTPDGQRRRRRRRRRGRRGGGQGAPGIGPTAGSAQSAPGGTPPAMEPEASPQDRTQEAGDTPGAYDDADGPEDADGSSDPDPNNQ